MPNLFVYGTLKKGFRNHHYLDGAEFLFEGSIKGTLLNLGWYPGLILKGDTLVPGEFYSITEDMLPALDRLEGHPHLFERTEMCLGALTEDPLDFYVYLYSMGAGKDIIKSGRWE